MEDGLAFNQKVVAENRPLVKVRDSNEKIEAAKNDPELFAHFRRRIARKTRGFEAPEAIIQCVEDAVLKTFEKGIRGEQERFLGLVTGEQSAARCTTPIPQAWTKSWST